jgi:hypothetical protein
LNDEETLDFKARIANLPENPIQEFTPIDPPSWVIDHDYLKQSPSQVLQEFLEERTRSITWLNSVQNKNWDGRMDHPHFGELNPK